MSNYDDTNQKKRYKKNPGTIKRQSIGGKQTQAAGAPKDDKLQEDVLKFMKANKADMETLSSAREEIMKQYLGEPYGNEIEGRSQVVITEISNKVESMMPVLMKIFYGGQDVVELRPQGADDEQKAKLMQEKLNFDFQKSNNGYRILSEWFKDALLFKFGVVKYYWQSETTVERVGDYEGLDEMTYGLLKQTPGIKILKTEEVVTSEIDELTQVQIAGEVTYNVKAGEIKTVSQPVLENLPLEEFIFDAKDKELKRAIHRRKYSRKEFKKMFGKDDDFLKEVEESFKDNETIARFSDLGGIAFLHEEADSDSVFVYEYQDNEKIIHFIGEEILSEQENKYGRPTFCILTPIIMSHRPIGRCPADQAVQGQKIETALIRGFLDNVYFQNNGVQIVNPYRVHLEDLEFNNKPGGKVRTRYDIDANTAVFPIPVTPLAPQTLKAWELVDSLTENATGITKYNQGMDSKSLNRTASGISQIMGASMQRMELIARTFAETGVKDLFTALVDMNLKFFDIETNIKINEEWVTITPEMIDGKFDVIIDVGVGTGSKEIIVQQMDSMLNAYGMIAKLAGPMVTQLFTVENIKNILKERWQAMGYKNVNKFVAPDAPQMMPQIGGMLGQYGQTEAGANAGQGEAGAGVVEPPVNQGLPVGY